MLWLKTILAFLSFYNSHRSMEGNIFHKPQNNYVSTNYLKQLIGYVNLVFQFSFLHNKYQEFLEKKNNRKIDHLFHLLFKKNENLDGHSKPILVNLYVVRIIFSREAQRKIPFLEDVLNSNIDLMRCKSYLIVENLLSFHNIF